MNRQMPQGGRTVGVVETTALAGIRLVAVQQHIRGGEGEGTGVVKAAAVEISRIAVDTEAV